MNIKASECAKQIQLTVHLTGMGRFRIRLWMAKMMIRLAVYVGGFGGVRFMDLEDGISAVALNSMERE